MVGFQQRILHHVQRNKVVLQQLLTGAALVGSASVTALTIHSKVVLHNDGSGVHFPPTTRTVASALLSSSAAKTAGMDAHHPPPPPPEALAAAIEEEDDDDEALFHGQCYQRQVYKPKLPYPAWDNNWDGREPAGQQQQEQQSADAAAVVSIVSDTEEEMEDDNNTNHVTATAAATTTSSQTVGKTRHILLIRHGQYVQQAVDDERRVLTPLGRRQAHATGQRLARMIAANAHHLREHGGPGNETTRWAGPCRVRAVHCSTLRRARETADIILQHVRQSEREHHHAQTVRETQPDPLLNEGLPAAIVPPRPDVGALPAVARSVDANGPRIEAAFQKYFHRAAAATAEDDDGDDDRDAHEFEIVVGHANVIRYFFCRALQLPPEAWLRLSLFNCSITYLMVQPNGYVTVRLLGDTGHIPYSETTFSGAYGYNWKSPTST